MKTPIDLPIASAYPYALTLSPYTFFLKIPQSKLTSFGVIDVNLRKSLCASIFEAKPLGCKTFNSIQNQCINATILLHNFCII